MKKTIFIDMLTGIGLMLLSAYWFIEATKMRKVELGIGPGSYPKFIAFVLFFLALLLLLQSVIKGIPKPEGNMNRKAALRVFIFISVTFVYVQAMKTLGFILLTPVYLYFSCWFFQYRKKIAAALASVVITAVIYIVFSILFYIPLPEFRLF